MGRTSKDKRDIYYRLAKEEGWRARSAFKLLQLDAQFALFRGVSRAVDLCAAPGSWSQVLARELTRCASAAPGNDGATLADELSLEITPLGGCRPHIVAVDLQAMAPLEGVTQIMGDITRAETAAAIQAAMGGMRAQLVVCDGAPDITGLHDMDEYVQAQLLLAALAIAMRVLEEGGAFVAKVFRGPDAGALLGHMRLFFRDVLVAKPASSRNSSLEAFVVCRGFSPPPGFEPERLMAFVEGGLSWGEDGYSALSEQLVPFVACGDLRGFDSDRTYALPPDYAWREPVQRPLTTPYADALNERRGNV